MKALVEMRNWLGDTYGVIESHYDEKEVEKKWFILDWSFEIGHEDIFFIINTFL